MKQGNILGKDMDIKMKMEMEVEGGSNGMEEWAKPHHSNITEPSRDGCGVR